ncbi:MAG TPA: hypothetical protein VHK88_05670, partial [Aquihabitans sp.]|nr:hypothetical protein [Aquihabitans sp.]
VNGVEVGRTNMPSGAIGATTPAAAYVGGTEDLRTKTYAVPGSLLRAGTNTISAEVHGWRADSGKVFFDLSATTRGATADQAPPSRPTLSATPGAEAIDLSWSAATDDQALGGYAISRDGATIAVVSPLTTTFRDATVDLTKAHSYVVTAFDAAGNATASTAVAVPARAVDTQLLAFGSPWKWHWQAAAPAGAWTADGYDDSTWQAGVGELGYGDTPKGTVISTTASPRPLASYYRTTVSIANPAAFDRIAIDLVRNSGAAVYVNGVEVGRSNLPAGPLTVGTYATAPVASADRKVPVRFEVPPSAFRAGTNTIAVELHLNYRTQPTAGFDLRLTGLR